MRVIFEDTANGDHFEADFRDACAANGINFHVAVRTLLEDGRYWVNADQCALSPERRWIGLDVAAGAL